MMSILLVFEKRDTINEKNSKLWEDAVLKLAHLVGQNREIELLAENCLLIPLEKGLMGISDVVRALSGQTYKYTILTQDIEWHEAPKDV